MTSLFAAILAWFAFGEIGFFIGLLVLSIIYTIATEKDVHGFAILATILGVGLFWKSIVLLGNISWPFLLVIFSGYFIIGGLWSAFRWWKFCQNYITDHPYNLPETDYDNKGNRVILTAKEYFSEKLKPSKHKSRLIGWIVYWPWSLIWNIAGDTLTAIYEGLTNVYQKISDTVINKALGTVR